MKRHKQTQKQRYRNSEVMRAMQEARKNTRTSKNFAFPPLIHRITNPKWPPQELPIPGKFPTHKQLQTCSYDMVDISGTGTMPNFKTLTDQIEEKQLYQWAPKLR